MAVTFAGKPLGASLLNDNPSTFDFINETGFGGPGPLNGNQSLIEPFIFANNHPLNQTTVSFPGFNFSASAGSTNNATSFDEAGVPLNWTFTAGLGLIDVETGASGYPLSAANTSSNLINVAFTLEFPGDKLPASKDTDWSLCAFYVGADWAQDVVQRAADDSGECYGALGASCVNALHETLLQSMTSQAGPECPPAPVLSQIDECKSYNVQAFYSSAIGNLTASQLGGNYTNSSSSGLHSGQIFAFQSTGTFDQEQADAYYAEYASKLWMYILTFKPSRGFLANHTGVVNQGQIRTVCTVLNKDAGGHENGAPSLRSFEATTVLTVCWLLLLTWL